MRKVIFLSILVILLSLTGYIYWYYYNPITDNGKSEGLLQHFVHKGNVFKTYEGDMLMMGFGARRGTINSNTFYFSVADEQVADSLFNCTGKMVRVHYLQYRRSLPWRGQDYSKMQEQGQFIVDRIEEVREAPAGAY